MTGELQSPSVACFGARWAIEHHLMWNATRRRGTEITFIVRHTEAELIARLDAIEAAEAA